MARGKLLGYPEEVCDLVYPVGSGRKACLLWLVQGREQPENLLFRDWKPQSSRGIWAFQSSPEWVCG